ncbi:MAG: SDR family NAD(P)-dependent oxidoreductase [Marmoricola sp.]
MQQISGGTILVTGANRGIGRALVEEALARGAARVYAATRSRFQHDNARVVPVLLDVTDPDAVAAAAAQVRSLDVLVNNAGISVYDDLTDPLVLEQHLAVNLFGMQRVTLAFLPLLAASRGAIVNNVSMMAFAPVPVTPAYSISKAAAFSLTQALRPLVAELGISVHAALIGPTDTDMTRGLEIPKSSPGAVAAAILDGVEKGDEDIFPDPMSGAFADSWNNGAAKALERQFAAMAS